jgi:hypothetical protein
VKLGKNERRRLMQALLIAIDTEQSMVDAFSRNRLVKGNLRRYTPLADRPTVRRAQRNVEAFEALYDKFKQRHDIHDDKK